MIVTTLGALAGAVPALRKIAALDLPVKPAYHLAKLLTLVLADVKVFEERRSALVTKYGTERAATEAELRAGSPATVTAVTVEHMSAFQRDLQELLDIEVSICWNPFDLDALGPAKVSGGDLCALGIDTPGALVTLATSIDELLAEKSI